MGWIRKGRRFASVAWPLFFATAALLAACSGGSRDAATPALASPAASVTIRIAIPKATPANARGAQYVSPATTQMTITIEQGGVAIGGYPQTIGLTPTSTGCTSTLADTLCRLSLALAPGAYTATISLLDAAGNALSGAQSVPFTVVAGASNSIPIVLGGIPHALLVSTESPATSQVQSGSQVAFLGGNAITLSVVATDADGNLILGPGAPTIGASVSGASSGSGLSVSNPSSNAPNTLTLASTGFGSAILRFTVTPSSGNALQLQLTVLATGLLTTVAGSTTSGFADGTGTAAKFYFPNGIAFDPASGDLYVADYFDCAIRQVTTAGVVTTIAGANPASCGFADGTGNAAKFNGPDGIAYDSANGDLYVADYSNCAIRQVTTAGVVTTIAGANPSSCGFADGTGNAAKFNSPNGIAYDPGNGDLYVADTGNCAIRQVTTAGVVTTIAGANPASCGFADGTGSAAKFQSPDGIAYDSANGDLYIADERNCSIRQVTAVGGVTTIAGIGSGACSFTTGLATSIDSPVAITYDATNGLFYITDSNAVQTLQL